MENNKDQIEYDIEDKDHRMRLEREMEDWENAMAAIPTKLLEPEKDTTKGLSDDEMRYLLFRPLTNKKELKNWIKIFLNVDLPDTTVDPTSNSNPLDMVWKLYETAIYYDDLKVVERHIKSLFYCARGSFKTMALCITELLIMIHSGRNTVHAGLIDKQAKNAYNLYFRPFLEKPYIRDWVKISSTLGDTTVKNRFGESGQKSETHNETTTLQIIPLTMNKTSSPRCQLLARDECDKCKGENVLAYQNSAGMLTMCNDRKMAMEVDISSRDSAYGMVQDIIDNAERTKCKVYHWNRIDICEKCPDSRSGTIPTPIYVKTGTLIAVSEEEYDNMSSTDQKNYEMHWGLDGCISRCRMFAACLGYLKNQVSKCKWLKPIDETERALMSAPSEEMAIAQLLCRTPPKTGLVYSDFDKEKNVKTPAQMYEICFNKPSPKSNLSTEELIAIFMENDLKCYIGCDAGYHHPAALLVFIDDNDNIYIMKESMPEEIDSPEFAHWIRTSWGKYRPIKVFPDIESLDFISALHKEKMPVSKNVDKKRQLGIATVKGFIRPPGTNSTKYFVNHECKGHIYEMKKWAYKQGADGQYMDEAEKKFDHCFIEGHEILTSDGWKLFENLTYEDKVAAITNDKKIIFEHPEEIITQDYDGEIYNIGKSPGGEISSLCKITPNHRVAHITQFALKKSKTFEISLTKIKDYKYTEIFIPLSASIDRLNIYKQPFPEWNLTDHEWAWLLGMFLAEGCTNYNHGHSRVHWTQKKEPFLSKLTEIMNKIKLVIPVGKWIDKNSKVTTFEIQQKKYYNYFVQFGKCDSKYIPKDIMEQASVDILKSLIEGLMDGDGSKKGSNNDYNTSSPQLREDFSRICTLVGYASHVKKGYQPKNLKHKKVYKIRINRRINYPTTHIPTKNITKEQYKGKIYCVRVSTGMIMCRYNGFNFISGNSCDAARYLIHTLYGKHKAHIIGDTPQPRNLDEKEAVKEMYQNKLSPIQIALANGTQILDNRDLYKEGQKKKKNKRTKGFDYTDTD